MAIKYTEADDVKKLADEITNSLDFFHVTPQFVYCIRLLWQRLRLLTPKSTEEIPPIH